jgi:hypothetical protein
MLSFRSRYLNYAGAFPTYRILFLSMDSRFRGNDGYMPAASIPSFTSAQIFPLRMNFSVASN